MPLYYGNTQVKELYYNNTKVKEMYYNNTLVYKASILDGTLAVGNLITFDNKTWRVIHNDGNKWYLALSIIVTNVYFNPPTADSIYEGSNLAKKCVSWMNENLSTTALEYCIDVTVESVTAKVFIPTFEQVKGGFSYYNSNANRICQLNEVNSKWWTSSSNTEDYARYVNDHGSFGYDSFIINCGFRPHICIQV